jgi:hypothetical protein
MRPRLDKRALPRGKMDGDDPSVLFENWEVTHADACVVGSDPEQVGMSIARDDPLMWISCCASVAFWWV